MKGRSLLYRPYEAAPEIIEREREISDVVAVMDRPLGKDVIAEAMMKFRELADKHASQGRPQPRLAQWLGAE